jgi:hypothetical protein
MNIEEKSTIAEANDYFRQNQLFLLYCPPSVPYITLSSLIQSWLSLSLIMPEQTKMAIARSFCVRPRTDGLALALLHLTFASTFNCVLTHTIASSSTMQSSDTTLSNNFIPSILMPGQSLRSSRESMNRSFTGHSTNDAYLSSKFSKNVLAAGASSTEPSQNQLIHATYQATAQTAWGTKWRRNFPAWV